MKFNVCLSVVAAMVLATACGGDDGKARDNGKLGGGRGGDLSNSSASKNAPAQCQNFIKAVCDYWIECGQAETNERKDCVEAGNDEFECSDAVSVSRDYADCIEDLNAANDCSDDLDLPSSCRGVINIKG